VVNVIARRYDEAISPEQQSGTGSPRQSLAMTKSRTIIDFTELYGIHVIARRHDEAIFSLRQRVWIATAKPRDDKAPDDN
jgi:hypothetical protein